ncbi:hypothetical protein SLEP1_g14704 [Rubroshorea leprosula]|uniref:Uncharacterized protein n=1 Tax=Rubroshorea leprosula TaxID=152421 RepID=A0AAV5ITY3_9ROSI|nr:hypothetical protein SLEP1_g14704 [Rubroshorea leprosula]
MFSTNPDLPQKNFQIKQDDKFFTRILSRETSVSSHSFTEYGGLPGAVPFIWESQPGTPKNTVTSDITHRRPLTPPPSQPCCPKNTTFPDISLRRPLTPPPSSSLKSPSASAAKSKLKHSRLLLLHALLAKMISLRKNLNIISTSRSSSSLSPPSSLISPRSWSSSLGFTAASTPRRHRGKRSPPSTPGSSFNAKSEDEEAPGFGSPTSTLCFAIGLSRGSSLKLPGCYCG